MKKFALLRLVIEMSCVSIACSAFAEEETSQERIYENINPTVADCVIKSFNPEDSRAQNSYAQLCTPISGSFMVKSKAESSDRVWGLKLDTQVLTYDDAQLNPITCQLIAASTTWHKTEYTCFPGTGGGQCINNYYINVTFDENPTTNILTVNVSGDGSKYETEFWKEIEYTLGSCGV